MFQNLSNGVSSEVVGDESLWEADGQAAWTSQKQELVDEEKNDDLTTEDVFPLPQAKRLAAAAGYDHSSTSINDDVATDHSAFVATTSAAGLISGCIAVDKTQF